MSSVIVVILLEKATFIKVLSQSGKVLMLNNADIRLHLMYGGQDPKFVAVSLHRGKPPVTSCSSEFDGNDPCDSRSAVLSRNSWFTVTSFPVSTVEKPTLRNNLSAAKSSDSAWDDDDDDGGATRRDATRFDQPMFPYENALLHENVHHVTVSLFRRTLSTFRLTRSGGWLGDIQKYVCSL